MIMGKQGPGGLLSSSKFRFIQRGDVMRQMFFFVTGIIIGAAVMFSLMKNRTHQARLNNRKQDNGVRIVKDDRQPGAGQQINTAAPVVHYNQVPATGQKRCYDATGKRVECGSYDFPGQDGFYQAGFPMRERFIDNGDGTVTDSCTGCMWQKATADTDGNGTINDNDKLTWENALIYAEELESAGHGDWRLPNIRELQTIVDYGSRLPTGLRFRAEESWYWSSSSFVVDPVFAWYVDFYFGHVGADFKGLRFHVRCVRL